MNKTIVTVTGPTCSGKSTLVTRLVSTGKFTEIVSTTTRPQRYGEVNGESYHFVTQEEFDEIEMLERITFNGNTYGGSIAEFEEKFASELVPAIVVEPHGMFQINRNATARGWTVVNVFVDCPPELQSKRFLERFMADYRRTLSQGDFDDYADLMLEYEGRMVAIMGVEQDWKGLFNSGRTAESLYIERFGPENEADAVASIMARAIGVTEERESA